MPHYFQPWNLAAEGVLGLVWTPCWAINTVGSVPPGYVMHARARGAGIPCKGGTGKDSPSPGMRGTRPSDPKFKAAAPDPASVIQIKGSSPHCKPSGGWVLRKQRGKHTELLFSKKQTRDTFQHTMLIADLLHLLPLDGKVLPMGWDMCRIH